MQTQSDKIQRHEWNSEFDVCEFIGSLIKMTGAANVLEIGVFEGETSIKMIEALPYGGKYTGIDINNYLKHNLNSFGADIDFILGLSGSLGKSFFLLYHCELLNEISVNNFVNNL